MPRAHDDPKYQSCRQTATVVLINGRCGMQGPAHSIGHVGAETNSKMTLAYECDEQDAFYLVAEDRKERVRAGRVGDVPDEQGHGLVVLDAPLREELGRDGRREDVVTFAFVTKAKKHRPDEAGLVRQSRHVGGK